MPLEQVKLHIQNAKTINGSYVYLWPMVEDKDRIDVINYELTDGTAHTIFAMPRLEEVHLRL